MRAAEAQIELLDLGHPMSFGDDAEGTGLELVSGALHGLSRQVDGSSTLDQRVFATLSDPARGAELLRLNGGERRSAGAVGRTIRLASISLFGHVRHARVVGGRRLRIGGDRIGRRPTISVG
jgi:hypothetical protein